MFVPALQARSSLAPVFALSCALVLASSGCEENPPEYEFTTAWDRAGLKVSSFSPMTDAPLGKGTCWRGEVADVDTVFCRYPDAQAAKAAHESALKLVGNHTGVALYKGRWLLAVADRNGVDPTGEAINQIAKTFLDHPTVKAHARELKSGSETRPERRPGGDTYGGRS